MLNLTINGLVYKNISEDKAYDLVIDTLGSHACLYARDGLNQNNWLYKDDENLITSVKVTIPVKGKKATVRSTPSGWNMKSIC